MKKIALFATVLTLCVAVNAQNLNVQSAMTDLKRGYLNKAKAAIDKACNHEDTKDDPKTWYYAGLIYSQIGDAATNPKSERRKYKDLDPDWCNKAYNAALRCKELDKSGEYAAENNGIFRYVGNNFYNQSITSYNNQDFAGARAAAEEAIKIFNNSGDADNANESYYIAGLSCQALNDNEGVKTFFGPLVRKSKIKEEFAPKMPRIYNTMFHIYKTANDTANVMKTAERYCKTMPTDPSSSLLLADAYIWTGNSEKGIALADKAIENAKALNDPKSYPVILCAAAAVYEQAGNFEGAEAKYLESAQLEPNQVAANYGMGIMLYNRGVDKSKAIDQLFESGSEPDEAVLEKLTNEYKGFLNQAIPYLVKGISYIDSLSEEQKGQNRTNLYNCLRALNTCYASLEMYEESKLIQERINAFQK